MALFVIPVTAEIQVEADSAQEAFERFAGWRKFVMSALNGHLEEIGIQKYSLAPSREMIEVDTDWLENQRLRSKFRKEWRYKTEEVPVGPRSKVMLIHKVALGPKPKDEPQVP